MNESDVWSLIARHLAGESSEAEEAVLSEWASDPANARLLEDARRVRDAAAPHHAAWDAEQAWARVRARLSEPAAQPVPERGRPRQWRYAAGAGLLAASLAAIVLLRTPSPGTDDAGMDYVTAAAETRTARLADGTTVRLGPSTRLTVLSRRAVRLDGLAFFAVEEDAAAPFEVLVPAGDVRVLGTRFEVRTSGDSARVTVIEGRVSVTGVANTIELVAGEVSEVVRGGDPSVASSVDPEQVADWMGRTLIFQSTPLGVAAREIEGMYGVRVQLAAGLRERTVTALFTDEPLESLVSTLCRAVEASCTVSDTLVMVEAQR